MSDILAEVDEIMHQERIERFFKEYGKTVLAAAFAIVVMTGVVSGYKSWNAAENVKGTGALLTLLDAPNFPENMKEAELDMRPGLRGIGLMTAAGAFLDDGKTEDALTLYARASSDEAIPNDLRDLATLMRVRLDENGDATSQQELLMKIWSNAKSPWRYHARLEAAALYAKQGDYAKAIENLNPVLDGEDTPKTLYKTARALSQLYTNEKQKAGEQGS